MESVTRTSKLKEIFIPLPHRTIPDTGPKTVRYSAMVSKPVSIFFGTGFFLCITSGFSCLDEDHNILTGEFLNNGQEVVVDQLMPEAGSCKLR